jgi:hypothetical protein
MNYSGARFSKQSCRGGQAVFLSLAFFAAGLAARAQFLVYNPGASVGQIEYSVQPIVAGTGSPLWAYDGFSSGLTVPMVSLYDILASPGGAFNSFFPSNPNIGGTGVVPLGPGIVWSTPSQNTIYGPFGGATMTSSPGGLTFHLADAEAPNSASVAIAAMSADFTVGPGGIPAGTFAGTTLTFGGTLDAGAAVAASLVTYIADNTTHQVEAFEEILAAGGTGFGNPYVAWSGVTTSFAVPVGASAGALVLFGGGGTTFTGSVSASQLLTGVGVAAGDDINILSVLTAIADPGATLDIFDSSANNLFPAPEPSSLSLLAVGSGLLLLRRKRARR